MAAVTTANRVADALAASPKQSEVQPTKAVRKPADPNAPKLSKAERAVLQTFRQARSAISYFQDSLKSGKSVPVDVIKGAATITINYLSEVVSDR